MLPVRVTFSPPRKQRSDDNEAVFVGDISANPSFGSHNVLSWLEKRSQSLLDAYIVLRAHVIVMRGKGQVRNTRRYFEIST